MDDTPSPTSAAKARQPEAPQTSVLDGTQDITSAETSTAFPNKSLPNTSRGTQDLLAMLDKNTVPEQQVGRHDTWESVKSFGPRTNTGFSHTSATTDITEPDLATSHDDADDQHASVPRRFTLPCRSRTSTFHSPLPSRSPSFTAMDRETVQTGRRPTPLDNMPTIHHPDAIHEGEMSSSPRAYWRGRHGRDLSHPIPHPLSLSTAARGEDEMDTEPSSPHNSPDPTPVQRRAPDNRFLDDPDTILEEDEEWTPAELSSSQLSDASDSPCDADTLPQKPDEKLIQDVCDGLLKHLFGVDLQELSVVDAASVHNSVSYCLHELFRVVPASLSPFAPVSQAARGNGESSQASIPSATGQPGQGNGGQATGGRGSKRRSTGGQNPGGDDFDNGNGPGDGKKPKLESSPSSQTEDKNLSCPFRKRNPARFNVRDHQSCAVQSFPDISQLKRHVKIFHGRKTVPGSACPRCKQNMSSKEELLNHWAVSNEQICNFQETPSSEDPEDGIDAKVEDLLNGRRANTKVDSWEILWRTLFPGDDLADIPDSVFVPPIEFDEVHAEFPRRREELKKRIFEEELRAAAPGRDVKAHAETLIGICERHIDSVFDACRNAKIGNLPGRERRRRVQKKNHSQEPTDRNHLTVIPPTHMNNAVYAGDSNGGSPSSLNTAHSGGSWSYVDPSASVQQAGMAPNVTMQMSTVGFNEMQDTSLAPSGVVMTGPVNQGDMANPTVQVRGGYHGQGQPHHHRGPSSDSAVGFDRASAFHGRHVYPGAPIFVPVAQQPFPDMNFPGQTMGPGGVYPVTDQLTTMSDVNAGPTLISPSLLPFAPVMNQGGYEGFPQRLGDEMDGSN